jgi:type I restriction enzyme S subunit
MREFPNNWLQTKVENLHYKITDGSHNPPKKATVGLPMLSARNILNGKILFDDYRLISESDFIKECERANVEENDILLTIVGSIGRVMVVPKGLQKFTLQRSVALLKPIEVSSKFLMYCFQNGHFQKQLLDNAKGTAQKGVYLKTLNSLQVPLPPLNEQHRIVSKIEELFSELDNGVANLKRAQNQLKVYRQALLKHAFEGKLTEQWRKENNPEPAEKLLERIKEERQNRYEQELKEWKAAVKAWEKDGKIGRKPGKPRAQKHIEIRKDEIDSLKSLPDVWQYSKIVNISFVGTGVTPLKSKLEFYENGDIPWVTSGALNDWIVNEPSDYVTKKALNETNLRIYPKGTLLVALYGEGKTRGKCSELSFDSTTNQAIAAIVQVGLEETLRKYLKYYFLKNYTEIRELAVGGAQPNLNLGIIENTIVPIPPENEIDFIIDELEAQFSVIQNLEKTIESGLQKSEALRQSILKKAFEGKLVPQDPNDEPASELLKRIQAEKKKYLEEQKQEKKKKATKKLAKA